MSSSWEKLEVGVPLVQFTRFASAEVEYVPGDRTAVENRSYGEPKEIVFAPSRMSLRAEWDGDRYVLAKVRIVGFRFLKSGAVGKIGAVVEFTPKGHWSSRPMSELPGWAADEVGAILATIAVDER